MKTREDNFVSALDLSEVTHVNSYPVSTGNERVKVIEAAPSKISKFSRHLKSSKPLGVTKGHGGDVPYPQVCRLSTQRTQQSDVAFFLLICAP